MCRANINPSHMQARCNGLKVGWDKHRGLVTSKQSIYIFSIKLFYSAVRNFKKQLLLKIWVSNPWHPWPFFEKGKSQPSLYLCSTRIRVRPRFFDQFGHETMYASSGNKHFFTKSCHRQTYQMFLEHLKICTFKVIFLC